MGGYHRYSSRCRIEKMKESLGMSMILDTLLLSGGDRNEKAPIFLN